MEIGKGWLSFIPAAGLPMLAAGAQSEDLSNLSLQELGNDPHGHALLNSAMDLGRNQTLDVSIRYMAKLPEPALPAYTELSARYAWRVSRARELSVRGVNLLHAMHREYPASSGVEIEKGPVAEACWRPQLKRRLIWNAMVLCSLWAAAWTRPVFAGDMHAEDAGDAQVLYIGSDRRNHIRDRLAIAGRSVLVVSDEDDALDSGSTIKLRSADQHVRFEVSLPSARQTRLRISSDLLELAVRVQK